MKYTLPITDRVRFVLYRSAIIGRRMLCYIVSHSQRTVLANGWLSVHTYGERMHTEYAVCVPDETMAHGYTVN